VGERRILAIGDASVRQLFWAMAKKLDKDDALRDMTRTPKEGDIYFKSRSTDVELQFVWDPYLNGTRLFDEVQRHSESNPQMIETGYRQTEAPATPATIIIIGGGMWYARQFEVGAARRFTSAVSSILLQSRRTNSWPSKLSSSSAYEGMGGQLFFVPVEQPFYNFLSPSRRLTILPDEIDEMNGYLQRLPTDSGLTIPWAFQTMSYRRRRLAFEESGLHVIDPIINRRADILLNLRCNAKLDGVIGSPFDRTCCGNYQAPSPTQALILLSVLIGLILLGVWNFGGDPGVATSLLKSFTMLGMTLAYCFVADRSQLFKKAHILFNAKDSFWLASVPLLLGLVSIRKSKTTKKLELPGATESSDPGFLARDQTDEIKGWMQAVLLLYHWTGASTQLWMYQIVRILLASYLFLTGYGHTTYFLANADYSFRRVAEVLVRLNLLACTLSYVMGTSYAFYYFAPLISFWFMVILATMRFRHDKNDNLTFLIVKIVASGLIITLFYANSVLIEALFGLLRVTYGVSWSPADWQFRISTDPYIVLFGMLVAAIHNFLLREPPLDSQR
jgi:N-acetylneuraminate 9-O-acetyltransferase